MVRKGTLERDAETQSLVQRTESTIEENRLSKFVSSASQQGLQHPFEHYLKLYRSEIELSEQAISLAKENFDRGPTLLSSLILYFEGDDWKYHLLEGQDTIVLAFKGHNGEWNCIAQVRNKQQQIVFYSAYEEAVPERRRDAVSNLLTRLNYQLVFGAFEFDFDDGELNFRTAIDANGIIPEIRLIRNMVHTNIITMDRYLPAIKAVISGSEPKRALDHLDAQD
jgi:hypothetical protein